MSARILNRPGIGYFFGTAGIGIRYLETGHSVSVFRYFPKTGHSISVFWYYIQTCIPINSTELIDLNQFIFSAKLIESIQFLFQVS